MRGPLPPLTPFFHLATRKKSERVKQGVLVAFHLIQGTAKGGGEGGEGRLLASSRFKEDVSAIEYE